MPVVSVLPGPPDGVKKATRQTANGGAGQRPADQSADRWLSELARLIVPGRLPDDDVHAVVSVNQGNDHH